MTKPLAEFAENVAIERSELITHGNGARWGFSDAHPGKFLIIPIKEEWMK